MFCLSIQFFTIEQQVKISATIMHTIKLAHLNTLIKLIDHFYQGWKSTASDKVPFRPIVGETQSVNVSDNSRIW